MKLYTEKHISRCSLFLSILSYAHYRPEVEYWRFKAPRSKQTIMNSSVQTAGTSVSTRKSRPKSIVIPQGSPSKVTTLLVPSEPNQETRRSAVPLREFNKGLVPVISSQSEASDRIELCVKRFDLPPSIDRGLLYKALHIEETKGYRTLEKLGDIAQQEVLYKIARDIGCDVGKLSSLTAVFQICC